MRSVFYVALAVAVFAHSSFVAAFAAADESALLSKTTPDFANDNVLSTDSWKRFLRSTDLDDEDDAKDDP
uniref:RxLR effector protein n=2 Tax=Phytophthora sojae TaxID=67593 RepID=E0W4P7_PHYSO|nr:Avh224 [Phytophthora sojae]